MTQQWRTTRPAADEHAPYYAGYVAEAPDGDLIATLEAQATAVAAQLKAIPESRGGYRYADGKWSIREVVAHVTDAERVFGFRALWFGRGDPNELPGFDENLWVPNSNAEQSSLADLAAEFAATRAATVAMLRLMPDEAMLRRGKANGREVSPRALAWIMAGHVNHHAAVLKDRYR